MTSLFIPDTSPLFDYGQRWQAGYARRADGYDQTYHAVSNTTAYIYLNLTSELLLDIWACSCLAYASYILWFLHVNDDLLSTRILDQRLVLCLRMPLRFFQRQHLQPSFRRTPTASSNSHYRPVGILRCRSLRPASGGHLRQFHPRQYRHDVHVVRRVDAPRQRRDQEDSGQCDRRRRVRRPEWVL